MKGAKLGLLLVLGLSSLVNAQVAQKQAFRLQIRSADPWFVKAMLEGIPVRSPEISTVSGLGGLGQAAGQGVSALIQNGKLMVNPADNSLWFIPNP